MASPLDYLRTRVARRVLVLFVVGALVPVLFMAGASFRAMSEQIRQQGEERLVQTSRNARQAVMQQLQLASSQVRLAAEALRSGRSPGSGAVPASVRGLALQAPDGAVEPLLGPPPDPPPLDAEARAHLGSDVLLRLRPGSAAPVLMAMRADLPDRPGAVLWASLVGDSIWGAAERFASGGRLRDFCLLMGNEPLHCRSGGAGTADAFLAAGGGRQASGSLVVPSPEGELTVGHAQLFLEAAFDAPPLQLLVAEATDDLYSADLSLFRYSFGLALLLGLLLVVLLASIQVRRTMTPLQALTDGTARLAAGDLATQVDVSSQDEFGELARSFNAMARRLGIQFRTLEAGRAIDRAVLSAMDAQGVVDALLDHFDVLVSCRSLSVLVLPRGSGEASGLHSKRSGRPEHHRRQVHLSLQDRRWLADVSDHRIVERPEDRPAFLLQVRELGDHPVVVLPLRITESLGGVIVFEARGQAPPGPEVVRHARQVADQATVALDAVGLVAELEEMSWGTLRALARAIDAKSRWTGGHSERVTELAVRLGQRLGLDADDLETLERGGLLHDVGKIGVPTAILDSPDALDTRGWTLVREHPRIGWRILEPIRAFAAVRPIVLQHHERWDGQGYPEGLAGTQIHRLARILAVADTYDAMASGRPYRDPLDHDVVLEEIRRGIGTQFEPEAARTFLEMLGADRPAVPRAMEEADG